MLLGYPFGPFGVELIGGGVFGDWEDLRSKFGQVFTCLEAFFVRELTPKEFFGLVGSKMGGA